MFNMIKHLDRVWKHLKTSEKHLKTSDKHLIFGRKTKFNEVKHFKNLGKQFLISLKQSLMKLSFWFSRDIISRRAGHE